MNRPNPMKKKTIQKFENRIDQNFEKPKFYIRLDEILDLIFKTDLIQSIPTLKCIVFPSKSISFNPQTPLIPQHP